MRKFLGVIVILFAINVIRLDAQKICPTKALYFTDSLGNELEKLKFPLFFLISKDSIKISWDFDGETPFAEFRILGKECQWNADTTIGHTIFKLEQSYKGKVSFPVLTTHRNANKSYIELLHENQEKRIFTIRE